MAARTTHIGSVAVTVGCLVLMLASPALADTITLADGNSVIEIDPYSDAGVSRWVVDGTSHLSRQWFWYRLGDGPDAREYAIDHESQVSATTLDIDWDGDDELMLLEYKHTEFTVAITLLLEGGSAGSQASDLAEIIRITNTSGGPLTNLHLFQYADFDLLGTPDNDMLQILGGNTAHQTDGDWFVAETVVTPKPAHYDAATGSYLLDTLGDDDATTLGDYGGALDEDNWSWSFQWDITLAEGGTFLISKNKNVMPEPATLTLMGSGLAAFVVLRRRW